MSYHNLRAFFSQPSSATQEDVAFDKWLSETCTNPELTAEQRTMCQQVMERGKFPYAHLDFMVTPVGETYLSEINLRGGIKGAKIHPDEYRNRLEQIHQQEVQNMLGEG